MTTNTRRTFATTRVWIILIKSGKLWKIHKVFNSDIKAGKYVRNQKNFTATVVEMGIE